MISDQLLSQFTQMLKSVSPPLIRVTDAAASSVDEPRWLPGDRLPATVLSNLPNGRFYVQVDNQTLELNLPKNTQPGDQMELVYVGHSPRLTFTLATAAMVPNAALATTTPQPEVQTTAALPTAADLSQTAHFLGQLSQQDPGAAQGIKAQTPVLPSPPLDPQQLAAALQKAINDSGLFYESHQAQWVQGEWPLENLMQEPQVRQQAPQGQAPQTGHGQISPAPAALSSLATIPALHADQGPESAVRPQGQSILAGIDPKIATLLQQQLQILNTGMIHWSGQAWPGQQMQWEISELPAGQAEGERQWQTRLNLVMPNLGAVSAWLLIGSQGLRVRLQADREDTHQQLLNGTNGLGVALQSAGLNLTQLTVEKNG